MTAKLRLPAGGTLLVAGLCYLAAATAVPADLPAATAKNAVAADTADLQKKLDDLAANPKPGPARTAKALALTLIGYGDDATKGTAAKVLLALDKKDYKGAGEAAKGLSSPKADAAALKDIAGKYDLEDVMSPYRIARSGGLNMEKDIRDAMKAGKMDPKYAEVVGARSVVLAEYTAKLPNDKAKTNPAMTAKWERWAKDMSGAGKELSEAGVKGDAKAITTALKKLDASCSNCHNDFRNE